MATLAQLPELALMLVVFVVTTTAGTLNNKFIVHHCLPVTGVAGRLFVTTVQLKLGELIVIKVP